MYSIACPPLPPPRNALWPSYSEMRNCSRKTSVRECACVSADQSQSCSYFYTVDLVAVPLFPPAHLSAICHCALAAWRLPVTRDWQQTAGSARGSNNHWQNNTKISIHKRIWCCSLQRSVPFNITFCLPLITPHMFCKQNNRDHLDNTLMSKGACWHPFGKKPPSAA